MKGDIMYKFVTDKAFLKESYGFSANLVNQLVQDLKHYGIISKMEIVGSGKRGFITQNGDNPIDFDFNLWIEDEGKYSNGHDLKNIIIKAFNEVLAKNDLDRFRCSDSTSVISVGRFRLKNGNRTEFSIDVCIVKKDKLGNWHRLIHDKTGITQNDRWFWNMDPNNADIRDKEHFLKANYWLEVKEAYLNKKNTYLKQGINTKPSFICYIEALNDVYYKYNQIRTSYKPPVVASGWGNQIFIMGKELE